MRRVLSAFQHQKPEVQSIRLRKLLVAIFNLFSLRGAFHPGITTKNGEKSEGRLFFCGEPILIEDVPSRYEGKASADAL